MRRRRSTALLKLIEDDRGAASVLVEAIGRRRSTAPLKHRGDRGHGQGSTTLSVDDDRLRRRRSTAHLSVLGRGRQRSAQPALSVDDDRWPEANGPCRPSWPSGRSLSVDDDRRWRHKRGPENGTRRVRAVPPDSMTRRSCPLRRVRGVRLLDPSSHQRGDREVASRRPLEQIATGVPMNFSCFRETISLRDCCTHICEGA